MISPTLLLSVVAGYFALLVLISYWSAGKGDNSTFFKAGRNSPWYLVAWGMIGASLSGVTFVSIPGAVGLGGLNQQFAYMQVVLGYLLGYGVVALLLLPLYYRLNVTSIYGYLSSRFGSNSYITGAAFFQLSRLIGSSFRLYLVALILDAFVLGPMGVPFWVIVAATLLFIYAYTFKGGIQTVVYTDTLQTLAMLLAVGITIYSLSDALGTSLWDVPQLIASVHLDRMFFFDSGWADPNNFWKQFFAGALITIVMTGLDQDMMQKNLTCRTLGDAQKNMFSFAVLLVPINLLFLVLGALLYTYMAQVGMETPLTENGSIAGDKVFAKVAFERLGVLASVSFIIGLVAAAYSSADGALTALTTSFCVDFLGFEKKDLDLGPDASAASAVKGRNDLQRTRRLVHLGFVLATFAMIIVFKQLPDQSVINKLFTWAGYTYGPLLGLFSFGMFTRWQVRDSWVPLVCVLAPILTVLIDKNSAAWFGGLQLGFLVLALNGLLTFLGLLLLSRKATPMQAQPL